MSHEATNWAVKRKGLKPIAKIVLWHLADCHNPSAGCFPTQTYLAEQCEISRSSVNRQLDELESLGLIRREQQIDPETKRQRPTRYRLAFEEGFEPLHVAPHVPGSDTEIPDEPCPRNDQSRVPETAEAVSQSYDTPTSNRTGKGTGNASQRADFEEVWEAFPRRPMTNRLDAESAFADLTDDETHRCLTAARRYHQWHIEDSAARDVLPTSQLEFRTGLGKWIRSGQWIDALRIPLKSDPVAGNESGFAVLTPDLDDFKAIAALRRKQPFVGPSGKITVTIAELEQARAAFPADIVAQARKEMAH